MDSRRFESDYYFSKKRVSEGNIKTRVPARSHLRDKDGSRREKVIKSVELSVTLLVGDATYPVLWRALVRLRLDLCECVVLMDGLEIFRRTSEP